MVYTMLSHLFFYHRVIFYSFLLHVCMFTMHECISMNKMRTPVPHLLVCMHVSLYGCIILQQFNAELIIKKVTIYKVGLYGTFYVDNTSGCINSVYICTCKCMWC